MLKISDAAFRAQGPSIDMTCRGRGGREQKRMYLEYCYCAFFVVIIHGVGETGTS